MSHLYERFDVGFRINGQLCKVVVLKGPNDLQNTFFAVKLDLRDEIDKAFQIEYEANLKQKSATLFRLYEQKVPIMDSDSAYFLFQHQKIKYRTIEQVLLENPNLINEDFLETLAHQLITALQILHENKMLGRVFNIQNIITYEQAQPAQSQTYVKGGARQFTLMDFGYTSRIAQVKTSYSSIYPKEYQDDNTTMHLHVDVYLFGRLFEDIFRQLENKKLLPALLQSDKIKALKELAQEASSRTLIQMSQLIQSPIFQSLAKYQELKQFYQNPQLDTQFVEKFPPFGPQGFIFSSDIQQESDEIQGERNLSQIVNPLVSSLIFQDTFNHNERQLFPTIFKELGFEFYKVTLALELINELAQPPGVLEWSLDFVLRKHAILIIYNALKIMKDPSSQLYSGVSDMVFREFQKSQSFADFVQQLNIIKDSQIKSLETQKVLILESIEKHLDGDLRQPMARSYQLIFNPTIQAKEIDEFRCQILRKALKYKMVQIQRIKDQYFSHDSHQLYYNLLLKLLFCHLSNRVFEQGYRNNLFSEVGSNDLDADKLKNFMIQNVEIYKFKDIFNRIIQTFFRRNPNSQLQ